MLEQLWAEVLARPDDDEPRRVLADALQERGDPRGEFIALQLKGETVRSKALLEQHLRGWLPQWPLSSPPEFVRGFPAHQALRAIELALEHTRIVALAPTLSAITFTDESPAEWERGFGQLSASDLGFIRTLVLPVTFGPGDPYKLVDFDSVESLTFRGGMIGERGAQWLARLQGVRELVLEWDVGLGPAGVAAFAGLPLTRLSSRENEVGSLRAFGQLKQLALLDTRFDLALLSACENLEALDLSGVKIGNRGVAALVDLVPRLQSLRLVNARLTDACAEALERFLKLKHLDVRDNALSAPTIERLRSGRTVIA